MRKKVIHFFNQMVRSVSGQTASISNTGSSSSSTMYYTTYISMGQY